VGEFVAPARATIAGPLLTATNSTITTLSDIITISRSTLVSTTTAPLMSITSSVLRPGAVVDPFTGTVAFGDVLSVTASGASPASVSLAGPFLTARASTITGTGSYINVVNLANGSTFTSTTTQPLIELIGSTVTTTNLQFINTGFSVFSAAICPAIGCSGLNADGTFATMNLRGPLLRASEGSSVNSTGVLVRVGNGGQIVVTGSTDPLVLLLGGTHALASRDFGGFNAPIFYLQGRTNAIAAENADGVALVLGTDEPLRHAGALFETVGATVTARQGFRLDTALVQASAPLLNLRPGSASTLTTVFDAIDLVQRVKLTSIGPVVKLDGSHLTVNNGALALVRNGSLLRVTGDFLHLSNASTLNLQNGAVLNVTGNSVVNITGAFVNFGGSGGNAINVSNTLCGASCTVIGGLNVNLTGGAVAGNVSVTNPVKNGGLGAINAAANAAVINVSGASSKVTISGN
jgi:hypothetical protein